MPKTATCLFYIMALLLYCSNAYATQYQAGWVRDAKTGEVLIGATVYNSTNADFTNTNYEGFFSISVVPQQKNYLVISYMGYAKDTIGIEPSNNPKHFLTLLLQPIKTSIGNVTIRANKTKTVKLGLVEIPISEIKKLPTIGGEADVLKAYQLLPGIQSGNEGASSLNIRGGSADQNLILLDNVSMYNVNHLGGFLSVFDINAINKVELYKSGFPAQYGNRLSSVIDLYMKEGNQNQTKAEASMGIMASKLFVEGPLNAKTTYMVSARRCNLDILSRTFSKTNGKSAEIIGYTFYDLYGKITKRISTNNTIMLSLYAGRDKILMKQPIALNQLGNMEKYSYNTTWGNYVAALKWNHVFNSKWSSSLTASFTEYFYANIEKGKAWHQYTNDIIYDAELALKSNTKDVALKYDCIKKINPAMNMKFGASIIHHFSVPNISSVYYKDTGAVITNDYTKSTINSSDAVLYVEHEWFVNQKTNLNFGIHANYFSQQKYSLPNVQPRISAAYQITANNVLKFGYSYMVQSLHLLSNTNAGMPTDIWVPATAKAVPENSQQFSINNTLQLPKNIKITTDVYYKTFNHLIEFREGVSIFNAANNWENAVLKNGKGNAYGIELLIEKKTDKLDLWLGYTLSYNYRKFDSLNNGKKYPYKYDRRHYLTLAGSYQLNDKISLSSDFVFYTGNAITLASAAYPSVNAVYPNVNFTDYGTLPYQNQYTYNGFNQQRMPLYHRLDVAAHFTKKLKHQQEREWQVSIYNTYNRQNAYFLYYDIDKNQKIHLYQVSLFPIIPSISYVRRF